jgi:hypothetical protein
MSLCVGGPRNFHRQLVSNSIQQTTIIMRPQVGPRYGSVICVTIPMLVQMVIAYLHFFHLIQWKKYLTTMQIVQFIVDLHLVYFGSESNPVLMHAFI